MNRVAERRALGSSSVRVTRLALGCAPLGNLYTPVSDEDASGAVAAALAAGIGYFDTAPLYGYGLSERRLGAALPTSPPEPVVVSTKVGRLLRPAPPGSGPEPGEIFADVPPERPVFDFSAAGTARSVEESLQRLGRDRVDVLLVHDPDDHAEEALAGAFPVLRRLRDEGVVGAIGAGMNSSALLTRFVRQAGIDCVLLAGRYTLLDQSGAADLLPACEAEGVSVIAAGVFNSGLLAEPGPGRTFDYVPAPAEMVQRARQLARACRDHDVSLVAAALQFALNHPAVACVLVGARSAAEVEADAAAFSSFVPPELWEDLRRQGLLRAHGPGA